VRHDRGPISVRFASLAQKISISALLANRTAVLNVRCCSAGEDDPSIIGGDIGLQSQDQTRSLASLRRCHRLAFSILFLKLAFRRFVTQTNIPFTSTSRNRISSKHIQSSSSIMARAWTRGQPCDQPCFWWRSENWEVAYSTAEKDQSSSVQTLSILTWNIDFRRSFTRERMQAALDFLQQYISEIAHPAIVMLNENLASDLEIIKSQSWVQDGYCVTDSSPEFWEHPYGECYLFF